MTVLLFLAAGIWVGGLAVIFIIVAAVRSTLDEHDRVALMRVIGRGYLRVLGLAGVVMLLAGAWKLRSHPFDASMLWLVITAVALAVALAVGVVQAKAMGRLRAASLATPGDALAQTVAQSARRAAVMRGAIVAVTLALIVEGAVLVTA